MADTGQMRFSVVIPTLARPEPLRETLNSVLACDPPADEVIRRRRRPRRNRARTWLRRTVTG